MWASFLRGVFAGVGSMVVAGLLGFDMSIWSDDFACSNL